MELNDKHLEDLKEIRSIMERSSRFIYLSGLSGIFAGLYALGGAGAVWLYGKNNPLIKNFLSQEIFGSANEYHTMEGQLKFLRFLITDAAIVLFLALATGIYLTTRQARKKGQSIWDNSSRRMIVNLAIPLLTGGFFSLILLYHGYIALVAPSTLIFYGLALVNGSKYTLTDIRYLGFSEIGLGLIAMLFLENGLLFWSVGFGILHIIYGAVMYFKYER